MASPDTEKMKEYKVPAHFIFGVSTSAFQVEGAWNEDGKGESIWDRHMHEYSQLVTDDANGDVACNSYHKYQDDVKMARALGVTAYRFSISWSRILPNGKISHINQKGIDYYNRLIDELLASGIKPWATIYHWDLPQALQDEGGWTNRKIIDYFANYARLVFTSFGDRVKHWITMNEIKQFCCRGYGIADVGVCRKDAPATQKSVKAGYEAAHHALLAHATVYRLYEDEFKANQMGMIGIAVGGKWYVPADPASIEDIIATKLAREISNAWILEPIFYGNYPPILIERVKRNSLEEGFSKSRLPEFTPKEQELLQKSLDFLSLNYYVTDVCNSNFTYAFRPSFNFDFGISEYDKSQPKVSTYPPSEPYPSGLIHLLNWIKKQYGTIQIIVTENGVADDGKQKDFERADYLKEFIYASLKAVYEHKCNVKGCAWSLMDCVEWMQGYSSRQGLYSVDFNNPERPRTRKYSSFVYADLIKNGRINWHPNREFEFLC